MGEKKIHAADLFAGAGGLDIGMVRALTSLGYKVPNIKLCAINHWSRALESHAENFPWANHVLSDVRKLNPLEFFPDGMTDGDVLSAAPECVFHSNARAGKPINDQQRNSAFDVVRWIKVLRPGHVIIENVVEFRRWGPLYKSGPKKDLPIPELAGTTYRRFISSIRNLGYTVDARVLVSADYGDPTTRKRLFIQAREGDAPLVWPKVTHSKGGNLKGTKRWRAAREIIEWSVVGQSIFDRKRPLSVHTKARIFEGLRRYGGPDIQKFLPQLAVKLGLSKEVQTELAEQSSGGRGKGFLMSMVGRNLKPQDVDDPMPTLLTRAEPYLFEPFILSQGSGGAPRPIREPVPTIPGGGAHALVESFVMGKQSRPRYSSPEEPVPTVTGTGAPWLTSAFILPPEGILRGNAPRNIDDPLQTVTQRGGGHLVEGAFIVPRHGESKGQRPRVHSIEAPFPTVTTDGPGILIQYNGMSKAQPITDPVPTVTTKDRYALVLPEIDGMRLDIRMRMLLPLELSRAMGFPEDYVFLGTRGEAVKMIGNAVTCNLAQALCTSLLTKGVSRFEVN